MSITNPNKIDTTKLDSIIESYGSKKSNLIAILQKVQEEYRYLPEDALIYIGTKIEGLSPAISIDQKTTSHNPRSTVGTVTEIYDYFRLLFARVGVPHCPICGKEISQQTTEPGIIHKIPATRVPVFFS